jgi:hypothetical protein
MVDKLGDLNNFMGEMLELSERLNTHCNIAKKAHRKEYVANLAWFQFMEKTYLGFPEEMRKISASIYEQELEAIEEIGEVPESIGQDYQEMSHLCKEYIALLK